MVAALENIFHGLCRALWLPEWPTVVGRSLPFQQSKAIMNTHMLVNFVLFQLGWFACVLGAAAGMPWSGSLLVLGIIGYHVYRVADAGTELHLMLLVLLIGFSWDSLLVALGFLQFSSGVFHSSLAPHWILAMWALFATTLNVSMAWLKGRYVLAGLFGLVGGPMAYYAGLKLGAVSMLAFNISMETSNNVTAPSI